MSTQTAPAPGSTFDIPGVNAQTQWFDQDEDTNLLSASPSQSAQSPITGIADFRRTDIVMLWRHHFAFTSVAFTAGTGQTLTSSAYAPYNIVGPVKLQIQNQYNAVDVESGIDIYIFNLCRPFFTPAAGQGNTLNGANPQGSPVANGGQGYLNASTPQTNLIPNLNTGNQWTNARTAFDLYMDIPAGIWLQEYYQLGVGGNFMGAIADCFVSPQFMAGTQRLIKTAVTYNQLLSTTTSDIAPVQSTSITTGSDTASTASATGTLTIRRRGVYASNNPASLPPPQPWQYRRKTDRFGIAGTTSKTLQLPDDTGQLLLCYLRMFDPSAASGVGAPITPASLTNIQLQYGSGLTWFNGTPAEAQMLWFDQHGFLLPQGVIAFDFAIDELGILSNKRCPNTLTTGGIEWVLTFASNTSSTAYAVMGRESLVYVT